MTPENPDKSRLRITFMDEQNHEDTSIDGIDENPEDILPEGFYECSIILPPKVEKETSSVSNEKQSKGLGAVVGPLDILWEPGEVS